MPKNDPIAIEFGFDSGTIRLRGKRLPFLRRRPRLAIFAVQSREFCVLDWGGTMDTRIFGFLRRQLLRFGYRDRVCPDRLVRPVSDPKKLYGGFGLIRIPTDATGRATARRIWRRFE